MSEATKTLHRNYVSLAAVLSLAGIAVTAIASGNENGMIDAIVVGILGILGVHQLSKRAPA